MSPTYGDPKFPVYCCTCPNENTLVGDCPKHGDIGRMPKFSGQRTNPLAGRPCTNLDHGFDGSVMDENGKCAKCEKLYATFSVQKRYPQFDVRLPVVAIDFDGVLAKNTWPSPALGAPDQEAIEMVKHYFSRGCEVIVFTARPPSHHERIRHWLAENGIFYAVYDVTNIKPVASVYVDDRAVRWPL